MSPSRTGNINAIIVAGDDIACARDRAADNIAGRAAPRHINTGAGGRVGNGVRAGYIGADVISFDEIAAGAGVREENFGGVVARNDIARAGNCAADGVALKATAQMHTAEKIGDGVGRLPHPGQ